MSEYESLYQQRRYAECESLCRTLLLTDKDATAVRTALINSLEAQGEFRAAIEECDNGASSHSSREQQAGFLHLKGILYAKRGELENAASSYREALGLDGGRNYTRFLLASTVFELNQFDECAEACSRVLKEGDNLKDWVYGHAIYLLTQCRDTLTADELLESYPRAKKEVTTAYYHFAIAELYDRQQGYASALKHYDEANGILRRSSKFKLEANLRVMNNFRQLFTADELTSIPTTKLHQLPTPVFIIGMPRTGSSLLEQMLNQHSKIKACGEVKWLPAAFAQAMKTVNNPGDPAAVKAACLNTEFQQKVREAYLSHLQDVPGQFTIDKLPGNFLYLFLIHLVFPDSPIIHITRDKLATIWSCYTTPFIDGQGFSQSITDAAQYHDAVDATVAHWRSALDEQYIHTEYETLVEDPRTCIGNILNAMSLELEAACLEHTASDRMVTTASRRQVMKPIFADANKRWQPYRKLIQDRLREK